jgi:hypothetical protein
MNIAISDTDVLLAAGAGIPLVAETSAASATAETTLTPTSPSPPAVSEGVITSNPFHPVLLAGVLTSNSPSPPVVSEGVITSNPSRHVLSDGVITSSSPSPPASLSNIDVGTVPAFLLCHGKGKRTVNIFRYLNDVQDPRFRQVLVHYIRFEISNKSGVHGSLATAKRPVEISQWSSRARPAGLPDYTKGGRSSSDFVDSILTWWAMLQPSWRSFERAKVSREVRGEWDVLQAPLINGLLNVVMLVYWWVKVLEEEEPEAGTRTNYEQFADDVAWVFSNLYV